MTPQAQKTRSHELLDLSKMLNNSLQIFDFAELSVYVVDEYFRDSTRAIRNPLGAATADFSGIPTIMDNFRAFLRSSQFDARYIPDRGLYRITRGTGQLR